MNLNTKEIIGKLFQPEEEETLVLDLGASLVKGIYLRGSEIKDFFVEKNEGDCVKSAGSILRKKGLLSKDAKISIKGQDTLIRYISFPKVDKKNLKEVFVYEVSKFIPFNKEDIYFDLFILDENYSASEFFLLLAVVKKKTIDSFLTSFQEAGINVSEINLVNVSLLNLFLNTHSQKNKADSEKNVAIIDIGYDSTLLNLVKKDLPCLSREIKASAKDFIQRLSRAKDISIEEAEKSLLENDQSPDTKEVIDEAVVELSGEIKNSLDYFEVNWGQRIQEIYVTGGVSKISGIDKTISNSLGIETKIWNPFDGLGLKFDDKVLDFKEMMASVLGLSL